MGQGMDKQLRKRFLGAGVVVALAALILPFLMQGEGYKANQQRLEDARTRIPPKPPLPERLDTQVPPPPEDVRAAMTVPEDLPKPKYNDKPVAAAQPVESAKPVVPPKPAPASEVKVKTLDSSSEKPTEKLPTKSVAAAPANEAAKLAEKPQVAKPAETRPAEPKLPEAKPADAKPAEAASAAPAKELWVIQLGSFTAESNAQSLLAQVQRAGLTARVEKIEVKGSPVWRVTSNTYASRAEAEAALNTLKNRANIGGMVRAVR